MDFGRGTVKLSEVLSFNYLRQSQPPWRYVAGGRAPAAVRTPLRCFVTCLFFVALTGLFETLRLNQAHRTQEAATNAYEAQARRMRDATAYASRVEMLTDLDGAVRRAAESGTKVAQRLASVARDLPSDAWLTEITPDASGLTLDGIGTNLDSVTRTLLGFGRDPSVGDPALERTDLVMSPPGPPLVRFSMHLSFGAQ